MANGYNKVTLVGNVTRDPELRHTNGNNAVCEIGLAVNDRKKNSSGEWVDECTFVDVTYWGRTAEVASEYLRKGSQILVEGKLKLDSWERDGQKRSKLRVVGDKMLMLGGRGEGGGKPASSGGYSAPEGFEADRDTSGTGDPDCPF